MTRIRYIKDDGTLVSKPIPGTEGNLVVTINKDGTFAIALKNGKVVYQSDKENKLNITKMLVKKELKALGAKFDDEVRSKLETTAEDEAENDYQQEHQN